MSREAGGPIVDIEMFLRELQAARGRSDRLQRRVDVDGAASTDEALAELETTLEELRVIEEELRVQNVQLTELYEIDADRDRWQDLFEHAPVALLLTDPVRSIREVNRRGLVLLGTPRSFLVGRPRSASSTSPGRSATSCAGWVRATPPSGRCGRGPAEAASWRSWWSPRRCSAPAAR